LKGSIFFRRYLEAMNNKKAPEVILIFPKGRHYSSYCDSADGTKPVETVIIKELRTAMFLVGADNVEKLSDVEVEYGLEN